MPDPRSMTLHGHRLSYTDSGPDRDSDIGAPPAGATILFVHGLMSSSQTWTEQAARLDGRSRVIAPDLFGHGASAKPPGDYSLGSHAATLRDLIDGLAVHRVTVVGHSLGGGVALQFAYLFPDRVDALVLVSSGGLGKEVNPLLRAATLPGSEIVLPLVASSWLHGVGDTALRYWGRLGLPPISHSSDEAWRNLSTLADGATRAAFLATSRSVINVAGQTVAARDRLPALRSRPSLLIWGARDRIVPSSHLQNARTELPDAEVEIFDRSGHFPHLDEPDRFASVLGRFLDGAVRTSGSPDAEQAAATPTRPRTGR
jgi:pimeloyl-ACP methyl ester carboxylesterase